MPIRRKLFNKKYCIYGHSRNINQHIKLRRYDRKQLQNKVLQSNKVLKNKRYKNVTDLSIYMSKLKEKEVEHTITWKKLRQSNTCQRPSGLCNLCLEEKVEILLSQAAHAVKQWCEVSTCRHVSPSTSIAPTSKLIKAEPNRPLHLSEEYRHHRRM